MQNARLTERAPFFAEVDVLSLGHTTPRRLWGTDVSEEGMFLQTTHPFRVGDRVSLRFGVQVDGTEEHEVHVRAAEVRWVRAFEPVAVEGRLPGIGLQFMSVDPPARAALRRYMSPSNRDDITLPERAAPRDSDITSGGDLGPLPPPYASLPPITGSIARAASMTPREITEEMFAVSLPPFSTPPRAPRPDDQRTSLPPDEDIDAVFAKDALAMLRSKPPRPSPSTPLGVPRDVTMLPKSTPPRARSQKPVHATQPPLHAVTDPPAFAAACSDETFENPLRGWRFEKVIYDEVTAPPTGAAHAVSAAPVDAAPTAPPALVSEPPAFVSEPPAPTSAGVTVRSEDTKPEKPAKLGLSFDDDRPDEHRSQLPSIIVEPSVLAMESAAPADASSGPSPAFEEAFMRGEVALADLPSAHERAPSPRASLKAKAAHRAQRKSPRSRALPTAIALIVVGTAVGAGLGLAGKRLARPSAPAPAAQAPAHALVPEALASAASPREVADVERDGIAPEAPDVLPAQRTKPALAPLDDAGVSGAALASSSSSPAAPVAPVAPAAAPPSDFVAKLAGIPSASTPSAPAAAKPAAKPTARPAKAAATNAFKLDIPVGDASVARTFTLSSPNRVVIDLEGGTLPKQALDGDGKKTKRVRFGTPKPGTGRVVIELADGVVASDVAAKVDEGRLALSFR